ncbi:MAG: DsbA family oxidoreductase [Actinomycetales bacterium]
MARPYHFTVLIEVWSDVVCPWCYVGRRRLQHALAAHPDPGEVQVVHRAFQLQPDAPKGLVVPTAQHLAQKYGVSAEQVRQMQATVTEAAHSVDLDFHLDNTLSGNTSDAHRLLLWAQESNGQDSLLEQMYAAYFTQGRSLFDREALLDITTDAGLDRDIAAGILQAGAFSDEVSRDGARAAQLGATGVPFFVFDMKYGISGAQAPEVFAQTLDAVLAL